MGKKKNGEKKHTSLLDLLTCRTRYRCCRCTCN